MKKWCVRIGVVFCVIFLTGCDLSPIKVASESSYTMTQWPKKITISKKSVSRSTILVSTPVASPGYRSSRMIYVLIPYQLKAFANHRWVAPPSELLLPLLADQLREAHYFKAVVTSPFSGSASYQLNTQLLTLQQEFLQPQSHIRLTMEATLIHLSNGHVVASRVFQIVIPALQNNPYGGVLAANIAANQMMHQIVKFVVKKVPRK
ncbi:MAG: hypothetical protein COY58_07980 [Gammaproteobacteria bacterium CG_4_10_14_0_8_um_filter_38_16]|nr:MAG: hypothetical protein COY58_07980 [Gammaproteobacteria bacterium CG_4_10_14_0_8_um_filter_38_16]PJA03488.1 MAG: hypothetical protein COX72_05230 [Gammaproteobacteria bacterium CG_4_10_14_0_2_um_filter_38_22]PJB10643.1 MAG: hypothetical protein CO120_04120 [Gammaproteobacteria bacterium CG_4_9_14_3_um_filter_38_9]